MGSAGYVYAMINYSIPNLVKVGCTVRAPNERGSELSGATGVATPFVLLLDVLVPDCEASEKAIHDALAARGYRHAKNREFFSAPPDEVLRLMLRVRDSGGSPSVGTPLVPSVAADVDTIAAAERALVRLGYPQDRAREAVKRAAERQAVSCDAKTLAKAALKIPVERE